MTSAMPAQSIAQASQRSWVRFPLEPPKWAISELLFVSVSKRVLVLNYCKENEFDLHKNTQLISI